MSQTVAQLPEKMQQAVELHQAGQFAQAQRVYEEILSLEPRHSDAINLLGAIAIQTGDLQRAVELYENAIEIDSNNPVAYCNSGWALWELKQFDAALARYDQAIAINPHVAEAHFNRGNVLYDLKQWDAALASYRQAIALDADHAEAHLRCGNVLRDLKQWDAALASYDQAICIVDDYEEAYFNRGNVLHELKQWDAALASFDQAIALKADFAEAYSNRGGVLWNLKRLDAALASFDQAIALKADFTDAYSNRGLVLLELKQWDAALASFDQAIVLKADYAEAYFNRSLTYLLRGDFEQGWRDYEWRPKRQGDALIRAGARLEVPPWRGEEVIAGKTILLYWEQGLGDTLQFCRYVKCVSDLGARVILEVQEPLKSLLAGLEGLSPNIASGRALTNLDFQCPLLSLPLAFQTRLDTIPAFARYLTADAAKVAQWQVRLGQKRGLRVGLIWSGGTLHKNDHNRSIALQQLIRHLPGECQYVSLQKEVRESDWPALQSNPRILHFADDLADFSDTAALCDCMDVVISVDTAVAHLSGALGKNTWILLPVVPDWRWLLDRTDSPWYPTVRLYRQERAGDWDEVLQGVTASLRQLQSTRLFSDS
jgi:tetratricopeptide (TPR) repeat protein